MSYCVHCGVELAKSERACPLCQTVVVDAREPFDHSAPKPFPARLDLFTPDDNRLFIAAIITLLLALPAAICLACDLAYTNGAGWSMLVTGAMGALWVFIIPLLFLHRHRVLIGVVSDTAAILGYLWIVERYAAAGLWFQQLAVPIVTLLLVLFIADYFLLAKVIQGRFLQMAMAIASVPILLVGIEISVDFFLGGPVQLRWSFFVTLPCMLLALLLLVLNRRRKFKEEMKKRLHM